MSRPDIYKEIDLLKSDPSPRKWALELRRLLAGERRIMVQKLGSAEDYVESILARSVDASYADTSFRLALNDLVQNWQPSSVDDERFLLTLLELIAAYTPDSAYLKVVAKLSAYRRPFLKRFSATPTSLPVFLRKKMLGVIKLYFPAPPPSETEGFKAYISLLQDQLSDSEVAGIAARHLLQLGHLQLEESSFVRVLRREPGIILDLLKEITLMSSQPNLNYLLKDLYSQVLLAGKRALQSFEEALRSLGAEYAFDDDRPLIQFKNEGISLLLDIPRQRSAMTTLMRNKWSFDRREMEKRFDLIAKEADRDKARLELAA